MVFRNKELNNLKAKRFLKTRVDLTDVEQEEIILKLTKAYEDQVNLRLSYFTDGVIETEYSKVKKIYYKKNIVKLKNKSKVRIQDITDIKEQ